MLASLTYSVYVVYWKVFRIIDVVYLLILILILIFRSVTCFFIHSCLLFRGILRVDHISSFRVVPVSKQPHIAALRRLFLG